MLIILRIGLNWVNVNILVDTNPHVLCDCNAVVVGGKVVAIDHNFIAILLSNNGQGEEASRQDPSVSILFLAKPLLVDEAVTDNVVVVYIDGEPEGDDITGVETLISRDDIKLNNTTSWGLGIDEDDCSRCKVTDLPSNSSLVERWCRLLMHIDLLLHSLHCKNRQLASSYFALKERICAFTYILPESHVWT